jgi:hypothetical protein
MLPDGGTHVASDNLNTACNSTEGDTDDGLPECTAPGLEVGHLSTLAV